MSRHDQRITFEEIASPRKALACACVSPGAYECAAIRHDDHRPREQQEPCECPCHDEPEEDEG